MGGWTIRVSTEWSKNFGIVSRILGQLYSLEQIHFGGEHWEGKLLGGFHSLGVFISLLTGHYPPVEYLVHNAHLQRLRRA